MEIVPENRYSYQFHRPTMDIIHAGEPTTRPKNNYLQLVVKMSAKKIDPRQFPQIPSEMRYKPTFLTSTDCHPGRFNFGSCPDYKKKLLV